MQQNKPDTPKKEKADDRVFKMEPRHEVVLETAKPDLLYEKAFLSREDKSTTEYAQNTTTWD